MSRIKKCLTSDTVNFVHPYTGETPLHTLAQSIYPKRKQVLEILLRKGALLNEKNKDFLTPLHIATDNSLFDIMDALLRAGANVNALDGLGQTALHRCAREDNVQACRILLSYSVDSSIISLQGYTAAQLAGENVIKILQGKKCWFSYFWILNKLKHIVCIPIDPPSDTIDIECQLLEAAKAGDLELVQRIVTTHPHAVNCRDLDGRHSTPLHFACGYNRVSVVEFLLENGAEVHIADKGCRKKKKNIFRYNFNIFIILGGLCPIHNSCSYGHYECTELLIKHGANVNVSDL